MITKEHAQAGYTTGNTKLDEALYLIAEAIDKVEETEGLVVGAQITFDGENSEIFEWNGEFLRKRNHLSEMGRF